MDAAIKATMDLKGMGGYLSVGDLDGDGHAEYVVTQGTRRLAAFDHDGTLLWSKERKGYGQVRVHVECQMPTLVYDIDGDGRAEVVARWYLEDTRDAVPFVQILDGRTGEIKRQTALPINLWPESVNSMAHSGKIVVGRIEHDGPPHLIVGGFCWGLAILDDELRVRFCDPQYGRIHDRMTGWGSCHTPALFDVDGDGVNEVLLGRTTCRADGSVLWTIDLEKLTPSQLDHVDSLAIVDIDGDGRLEVVISNEASVLDALTGEVKWQRSDLVTHGQQLRVARVRDDVPGPQILVGNGHNGRVYMLSGKGDLLVEMPYSGMLCPLNWLGNGLQQISLGAVVRDGNGAEIAQLPLDETSRTRDPDTWGHTMACDVDGDGLEEVVWVNKARLSVFGAPQPAGNIDGVVRDDAYWTRIANSTRY